MSALDPYADDELAELYDLEHGAYDADLPLYEQFARRAETSLELGVGTGRVAKHLARQGHRVTGIDSSPRMLARLAASLDADTASRLRLIEADMRDFNLGEQFDLVYCALNTFEHLLSTEDQLAALSRVARHLAPAGAFVLELRPLTAFDWSEQSSALQLQWTRTEPRTNDVVTKTWSAASSPARQLTANTIIYDRTCADSVVRRRTLEVTLRLTGRFELELLLRRAGLRLTALYGDADLSPFDDGSDTMIAVGELEGAKA